MARGGLTVLLGILLPALALSACGSGTAAHGSASPPACLAATAACRVSLLAQQQTHEYEMAGASHHDAACLAAVTARIEPPAGSETTGSTTFAILSGADQRAIDRCHISERTFNKIGDWVRTHIATSK